MVSSINVRVLGNGIVNKCPCTRQWYPISINIHHYLRITCTSIILNIHHYLRITCTSIILNIHHYLKITCTSIILNIHHYLRINCTSIILNIHHYLRITCTSIILDTPPYSTTSLILQVSMLHYTPVIYPNETKANKRTLHCLILG